MIPALQATVTLNEATTYPLPTAHNWQEVTDHQYHDLALIIQIMTKNGQLTKAQLSDTGYYEEWKNDRLEIDHGILYRYEVKHCISIRQLQVKIVPPALQRVILAACHLSPMAGHSSVNGTYR
jgi:hypothetical protein